MFSIKRPSSSYEKMASVELPEVVAVCINLALNSGRTLSWKIQESCRGTSVQLFWKGGGGSDCSLEPQVELAPPRTKKKKSPSQIRRNQRRLAEFMKTKSQEYSSSTRPLLENTPTRENPNPGVNMADTGVVTSRSKETSPTLQTGQELHIAAGPPMKVDTPSPYAPEPTSTNSKCIDLSKINVILSTLKKGMMEFQESVIHLPLVLVVGHLLAKAQSHLLLFIYPIRQLILHSKI